MPKRYAPTAKVPNTRGCYKCCYGRNAYNGFKYLCGALPNSIILMQWYDPLNKYMLLKVRRTSSYLLWKIENIVSLALNGLNKQTNKQMV